MKIMKKGVSVLLVFLLVFGMFAAMPMSVSAATDDSQAVGDKYGDFVYTADTDEYGNRCVWITDYLGNDSKVTIPNTIKNMYVIGIDQEVFAYNESLRYVSIPKTVKYIGYCAFSGCINLQEVTLPKDLIYLDAGAFLGCISLKTVTIPSTINFFGYGSFAVCDRLQEFKVTSGGNNVTAVNGVLYSGNKKMLLSYPCGKPGSVFKVPASVEEIAPNSFMGNLNIKKLIIQNKCKTIGDYAFAFSNIGEILVPNSVKEIGSNPFEGIQNVLVYCNEGSAMYRYCQVNEINGGGPYPVLVTSIKLNTNKISWPVGKSGSFKPTVTPSNAKNKALTWKSSNPKVATVDANGKLKAVGIGSATITCTAKDGSGAKATCAVTVYQPVKSVKLNTNKISWPVGKSGSFKPTVTPSNAKNKALTWKSRNPKVATVDANGKLRAVGVGSTTITCTAKDGSGAKATCAVTVYQPIESIKLNTNKISWPVGKSGSFKPTVAPANAKNKALTWKSSNPKVATVDANGKLKAVGVGSTTITCTAKDGSGAKATCAVTVYDPKVSVYKVGDKIIYTAYLSGVNAPLCGINASIRYDGDKARFNDGTLSFPYIGKPIYNTHEKNEIFFNTAELDGFDFSKQEVLVQATFTVTDASFNSKDISLKVWELLDFNAKDLKGTIKETVTKG